MSIEIRVRVPYEIQVCPQCKKHRMNTNAAQIRALHFKRALNIIEYVSRYLVPLILVRRDILVQLLPGLIMSNRLWELLYYSAFMGGIKNCHVESKFAESGGFEPH